jgi:four helix bundle protein
MVYKSFEELPVWKLAFEQFKMVVQAVNAGTFRRDFALRDQILRSSGSVVDNIAEGFGRGGNKELINFLSIARGSHDECRAQMLRAHVLGHVDDEFKETFMKQSTETGLQLTSFMQYLSRSTFTGTKYRKSA